LKERSDAFTRKFKVCNNVFCTVVLNVAYIFIIFYFFICIISLLSLSDDDDKVLYIERNY